MKRVADHEMRSLRSLLKLLLLRHTSHCLWYFLKDLSVATLIVIISTSIFLPKVEAFHCKFPNEGCDVNNGRECCSGKCVDLHPGTNARCTRLSLHKPCLYTYQCDDRLRCGANNTCCAKYWGTCTKAKDCCDPQHACYEVEGFYYKRCLYSTGSADIIHGHRPFLVEISRRWHHLVIWTFSLKVVISPQINYLLRTL